jgi:WD40 repeat protein
VKSEREKMILGFGYFCDAMLKVNKITQLSGHSAAVYVLVNGSREGTVFTGSADNFVAAWDLENLQADQFAVKLDATVYSVCFIEEFNWLVIGLITGAIHVIDLKSKQEVKHFTHHKAGVFDIQYSTVHKCFYTVSADGSFSIWDAATLQLQRTITLGSDKLRSIALNADHSLIAIAGGDTKIRLFDTQLYNELYTLEGHEKSVNTVRFHPNGKWLMSGGWDAHLRFWDVEDGFKLIRSIPAHNFAIYSIVFSPDEKLCATGSRDKTLKIWDASSFELIQRLNRKAGGHLNSVNKLYWSDYKNYLISTGDDRSLIVWEVSS